MPDTPYGVTGCLCRIAADYSDWTTNPHCPYHGILPRDRTDTGVYRVVVTDTGADTGITIGTPEHPVWPGAVDAINAVFQAGGEHLVPEPVYTPTAPAEAASAHLSCDHPDCIGIDTDHHEVVVMTTTGYVMECVARGCPVATRLPDGTPADTVVDCEACEQYGECLDCEQAREDREELVRAAAERVERVSEGLNQRLAEGPRCKGAGYCVYHDVPTVHDTGPLVAQKKPAEATADCTCLPGEGPCRCAGLDEGLKHYEQPMPSDVVRKLVDFIKADEPAPCDADTDGCNYQEPHKHGFACDKACDTCHGHYDDIDPDAEARGLNERLVGCTCGGGSTDRQHSCPRHGYDGDIWDATHHTDMAALNRRAREKYGAFSKKPAWWRRLFRR